MIVPYHDGHQDLVNSLGLNSCGGTVDVEMDSWQTVERLKEAGFTTRQGEVLTDLIGWILRVRLNEFRRSLVNQPQSEYVRMILCYTEIHMIRTWPW